MAPETIAFSCAGLPSSAISCVGLSSCEPPHNTSYTFSAPSNDRYAPPIMSRGVMSQGTNWLRISATGRMKTSLLRSEPMAIFKMTGSSRSARKPWT